jgi:hypothetical protein
MQGDLFAGTRILDKDRSQLPTPPPLRWIQKIDTTGGRINVREEITGSDGSITHVEIDAPPDGEFYPVSGSPFADSIAYKVDGPRISGIARKDGVDTMRISLVFSHSGEMTMTFSVLMNSKEVGSGTAHFTKAGSSAIV